MPLPDYQEAYGAALRSLGLNQSEVDRQKQLVTSPERLSAYDLAERNFDKIIRARNTRRDAQYAKTLRKIFCGAMTIMPLTLISATAAAFVFLA
jgi:hypothetical protein